MRETPAINAGMAPEELVKKSDVPPIIARLPPISINHKLKDGLNLETSSEN